MVNEDLEKYNSKKIYSIKYKTQNKEIDEFIEKIKSFNDVYYTYEFAKCPLEALEDEKYLLSGEMENIVTKPGKEKKWIRILSKNVLDEKKEYIWKIKILKTNSNNIMVGVAQIESIYLDNNNVIPNVYYGYPFMPIPPNYLLNNLNQNYSGKIIKNLGWYFCCKDSKLYSDYPHNYSKKKTKLKFIKDEIKVVMNLEEKTLKFIVENEDKEVSYENMPIDMPLTPAVLLFDENDSVEIIPC